MIRPPAYQILPARHQSRGGVTLPACLETRPSIRRMDALGKLRNDSLQELATVE